MRVRQQLHLRVNSAKNITFQLSDIAHIANFEPHNFTKNNHDKSSLNLGSEQPLSDDIQNL